MSPLVSEGNIFFRNICHHTIGKSTNIRIIFGCRKKRVMGAEFGEENRPTTFKNTSVTLFFALVFSKWWKKYHIDIKIDF